MTSFNGGFGSLRFPAPSVDSAAQLDPGHEAIIGLLKTAINSELGNAWTGIVAELDADHYLRRKELQPVSWTSDLEATPQQLTQFKTEWPILCVYRQGEPELVWLQNSGQSWKQQWSVDWIVGPLKAAHIHKVGRFAISVARCICRTIDLGYHPNYNHGICCFFGQFVQIDSKGVAGPGIQQSLTEESGSGYYGLTVTLETIEREYEDAVAKVGEINTDTNYVKIGTGTSVPLTEIWVDPDLEGIVAAPIPPALPT